ncbi:MAG: toprim domain-containing protein [Deltaproteobacteria bacterium]|nr:toprim domain-containing protein [Deltaproteobacteria bacterium]
MTIYIPEDKVSEIKNTADIVEVVSEVVLLKKTGKNYVGLCPFHSEKTPSFTVSPEKQIFYCFGCAAGGNVFSFLMKHDGISFPDAAKMLAVRYGIDIPTGTLSPEQKRRISQRESLFAVNRQAMEFFRNQFLDAIPAKRAMEYVKKRGINRAVSDNFNLGYAPKGWDNLLHFFKKKNISLDLVEKADMQGIGFGGRVMDDSLPKYLNSPETPVYNKSRSLYGLHLAKKKCRENQKVYIVEGYFDLIALHQHGVQNSVATLGTSLTPEHVQLLKGFIGKDGSVILVFDSDDAGVKASQRTIEVFDKAYMNAQIVILPDGYDPDSYLFEFGVESFLELVSRAKYIIPFLMDSAVKKHGLSIEGKIRVISEMKEPLGSINDNDLRSLYIKELSERINIDELAVLEKVRKISLRNRNRDKRPTWPNTVLGIGQQKTSVPDKVQEKAFQGKWDKLERQIIAMMLQFPQILSEISERNILELFENNALKSIGQLLLRHKNESELQLSDIMNLIEKKEHRNIVASLAIEESMWDRDACIGIITRFDSIRRKDEKKLLEKIKAAEKDKDFELLVKLLNQKQKMALLTEKKKMALLK